MAELQRYAFYFLIWLVSTILIRKLLNRSSSSLNLPPTPFPSLPIIGHLHLLAPIPHQSLAQLASRYGPLIRIDLGSVPCLVVSSPEIAKEFLKTHEASFSERPQSTASDILTYGSQDFTFAPYGPYWKFMKKLCMSELLGGQTLDLLQQVRRHEIMKLIDFLSEKAAKDGEYVDIGKELINMVSNVISSMIMSQRCCDDEDEARKVRQIIRDSAEILGRFDLSDYVWFCKNLDLQGYGKRSEGVRDRFDEIMEKIIDEHVSERIKILKRRGEEENVELVKDMLHILLDASEAEGLEMKLTRANIKSFVLDVLVAGTDTSAITTEWALSELINHPDILQKAVREIDSVVGKTRLVEESDIPNLPYLQAVVKETLRLHPPGPLLHRRSSKDCTVMSYHIPAKTYLFVNVWAINRDPNYWENPLEFKPERFLMNGNDLDVRGQHYHFLPFGSGRRGCPGISLGMKVVQATLGALIQRFEWRVENDASNVNMDEGVGLTLPRAHPLVCMPVARINPISSS